MQPSSIQSWDYRGAEQTVALIKRGALAAEKDFAVRQLAERVCSGLRGKDYASEAVALTNFVESCGRYMRDPKHIEMVKSPSFVARQLMQGERPNLDCDDQVVLLTSLLLVCGFQVRIVIVAFRHMFHNKRRQYSHVLCEALEPKTGTWIVCDPVAGKQTAQMLRRVVARKHIAI